VGARDESRSVHRRGFDSQQKHIGQEGVLFTPVSRERQVAAIRFLHENAFKVPDFAVNPDILRRIEPVGVLDRVENDPARQPGVEASSMSGSRLVTASTILSGTRLTLQAQFRI
jgi:hypothetical protein